MFSGFSQQTVDFMWNLRFNNNKPWFEEHKDDFIRDFQNPMKELGKEVFDQIASDFPKYGFIHKVSRIYKDARRVKDGEPYRSNMWFCIEKPAEEWTATPVFWFEVAPEAWSFGLGYYAAKAATMAKLRARIEKNPKAFEKLVAPFESHDEFTLDGEEYVRKKTAPTKKTERWYNFKSFSLISSNAIDDELFSSELKERVVSGFKSLMPLYDYLITLDSDPTPERK